MTDKNSRESRRKILKSIAAGSGVIVAGKTLPDSWSRPVVDSVMLPAHAQTSGCGGCYPFESVSVEWIPGVPGTVNFYRTSDCSGSPYYTSPGVEAATAQEAAAIVQCNVGDGIYIQQNITGCTVWYCDA